MPRRLRSPYTDPLDYAELGRAVPALAPHLNYSGSGYATLDFKDDEAVRRLNTALLERDFSLQVTFPEDRLCPSVPGRLDYVLHCLELVRQTRLDESAAIGPTPVTGLDIGTGASAIYPLLATRFATHAEHEPLNPVRMLATDIDAISLAHARQNVERNAAAIQLFHVDPGGPIFPPQVIAAAETIDFTMCNPPFYSSAEEIASSSAGKELPPCAVCTAADNELITPGGEVAFVGRMIDESVSLGQHKIRWFTSLLGKYSSITPIVQQLKNKKILNYHVSSLPRRGRTVRWVLCWSLQEWRIPPYLVRETLAAEYAAPTTASVPSFPIARFVSPTVAPLAFVAPTFEPLEAETELQELLDMLKTALNELVQPGEIEPALEWSEIADSDDLMSEDSAAFSTGHPVVVRITAWRNVWSRQARRAAKTSAVPDAPKGEGRGASTESVDGTTARSSKTPMFEVRVEIAPVMPGMHRSEGTAKAGPAVSISAVDPCMSSESTRHATTCRLEGWWLRGSEANRAALVGLWGFLTRRIGDECRRRAAAAEIHKNDEKRRIEGGGDNGREKRQRMG